MGETSFLKKNIFMVNLFLEIRINLRKFIYYITILTPCLYEKILDFATVAHSFVCGKYCLIMD